MLVDRATIAFLRAPIREVDSDEQCDDGDHGSDAEQPSG